MSVCLLHVPFKSSLAYKILRVICNICMLKADSEVINSLMCNGCVLFDTKLFEVLVDLSIILT